MRSRLPTSSVHPLFRLLEPRPAALVWAVLVALFLVTPGSATPRRWAWLRDLDAVGGDKVVHFLLFAVLAVLLARWWSRSGIGAPLLAAALVAMVYGGVTEALQMVVPARSPEWLDLVADGVGALAGAALFGWRLRRSRPPVW